MGPPCDLPTRLLTRNDIDRFIRHGEEALLELPDTPELLAPLANIYSESKRTDRATDYATRALQLLDQMEKPMGQATVDWIAMKQGWAADAHYALGRSILEVWTKSPNKPVKDLEVAVEHLKQTLKMNPGHGYAAFRLGFAASRTHDYDTALLAYARAAVVEGPAAESAKGHVRRLHDGLRNVPNSRWASTNASNIIRDERERLAAEMDAKEQEYSRLAAEYDSAVPPRGSRPAVSAVTRREQFSSLRTVRYETDGRRLSGGRRRHRFQHLQSHGLPRVRD